MLTIETKEVDQWILKQRKMNKLIAKTIDSDEQTAFYNGTQVKRLLTVPVTKTLFLTLVKLCSKFGVEVFAGSIALQMVNTKASVADRKKYIEMMLAW